MAVTLGGALLLIRDRASKAADAAIDQGLAATQSAIEEALAGRSHALQRSALALAQVPAYISRIDEALRAGQRGDLIDQADEFRQQSEASWALITDQAGVLQASTRSSDEFGDSLGVGLVANALGGEAGEGIWIESTPAGDSLFQAVAVPLAPRDAPVSGALVLAVPIDAALAQQLKRQTASEVVFLVADTGGVLYVAASTLPPGTLDSALSQQAGVLAATEDSAVGDSARRLRVKAGGLTWIATAGPLRTASGTVVGEYAGLRAREAELAPFDALQRSVLVAFLGALGIALVISLFLARQITRPLRQLVGMTRDVAQGRYSGTLDIRSRDEIGELADAFRGMLAELREKQRLVEFLGGTGARTVAIATPTAAVTTSRLGPGSLLANRYEIRQQLGAGGMGVVYRAFDRELKEQVAIKTLKAELLGDPSLVERFKQEIRLARRISHPNVVRTHDLGEADGIYFITMEFVEGTTLDEVLGRRGALPLGVALTIGKQLCRALEVAHEQGVVHRDIKPQNLVVDAQGFLKVMDFGIARLVEARQPAGAGLTAEGSIIGTPEYMAPEQLMGQSVDGRADLYAAGAVLFECITGKRLFSGTSFATVLMKQVQETPPDPRTLVPGLSEAFARLVLKALAKKPEDRWQTAAEFHQALDRIRE